MRSLLALLLFLAGPALAVPAVAEDDLWRWEDAEGDVHYSPWDQIPPRDRPRATRVTATVDEIRAERDGAPPPLQRWATPEPAAPCRRAEALRAVEALPGPVDTRPGVHVREDRSEYEVMGATPIDIRNDLDRKRPGGYDAQTRWRVDWRYGRDTTAAPGCRLDRPVVTLHLTQRLPRLGATTGRDGVVAQRWAAYLDRLRRHEAGHLAVGAAAANDILELFAAYEGRPCGAQVEAARCAHAILEEYRRIEHSYDGRTRHGMGEGAVFP